MLNGLDPIILFQFKKLPPSVAAYVATIPVVSTIVDKIGLPPIPIYLSESATGLMIQSEDKSIDIETTIEALSDGGTPHVTQKSLNSTVSINFQARKGSLGLILVSAICDLIIPKVTSQEYGISYFHAETTIFDGLLHSFKVGATKQNDLVDITLELVKTVEYKKATAVNVEKTTEAVNLGDGGAVTPTQKLVPPLGGPKPLPSAPTTPPPIGLKGLG